jgi:hypothetical protein
MKMRGNPVEKKGQGAYNPHTVSQILEIRGKAIMLRMLAIGIVIVIVVTGLGVAWIQNDHSDRIETWSRGSDWPAPQSGGTHTPTPAEAQAIESAVQTFFEALNSHDAEAFDRLLVSEAGGYWWTLFYKSIPQELTFQVNRVEIISVGSGRCETMVTTTVTSSSPRVTIVEPTRSESMHLVLKESQWKVVDPTFIAE